MTDTTPHESNRRIDLRALDYVPVDARRDSIIDAAIARAMDPRAAAGDTRIQLTLANWAPRVLAAAVLFLVVGLAALRAVPRAREDAPTSALASWIGDGRVPSNGEVLAQFGGYVR